MGQKVQGKVIGGNGQDRSCRHPLHQADHSRTLRDKVPGLEVVPRGRGQIRGHAKGCDGPVDLEKGGRRGFSHFSGDEVGQRSPVLFDPPGGLFEDGAPPVWGEVRQDLLAFGNRIEGRLEMVRSGTGHFP